MTHPASKTLGIIGGLGPIATAYLMELITAMTDAKTDQDHIDMIVYSTPSTPDRTSYILDNSAPNPLPCILQNGHRLVSQGAECIAIPCMTAHYFYDCIQSALPIPVIHGIRATALHLRQHGIQKAGIMATDGSIRAGVFYKELTQLGIEPVFPDTHNQQLLMSLIYQDIKAGVPADISRFTAAANYLRSQGVQVIILGCTELSIIKRDMPIGPGYIDTLEVLAQQAVLQCQKPLKPQYRTLIT